MPNLYSREIQKEKKDMGDFCQKELLRMIELDYYDTFRERVTAPTGYPDWSPNLIRRIIISPSALVVTYHIYTRGIDSLMYKYRKECVRAMKTQSNITLIRKIESEDYKKCIESTAYKPILSALTTDRLCSAVEEIIICTKDKNSLSIRGEEFGINTLLDAKNNKFTTEDLINRYNRLYSIIYINVNIEEILDKIVENTKALVEYDTTLTDIILNDNNLKGNIRSKLILDSNFNCRFPNLQGLGSDRKGYIIDTQNGKLHKYFESSIVRNKKKNNIVINKEEKKKNENIENFINLDLGIYSDLIEYSLNSFVLLSTFLKKENLSNLTRGIAINNIFEKSTSELIEYYSFNKEKRILLSGLIDKNIFEKLKLKKEIKSLINAYLIESNCKDINEEKIKEVYKSISFSMIEGVYKSILELINTYSKVMPMVVSIANKNSTTGALFIDIPYTRYMLENKELNKISKFSIVSFNKENTINSIASLLELILEITVDKESKYYKNTKKNLISYIKGV